LFHIEIHTKAVNVINNARTKGVVSSNAIN